MAVFRPGLFELLHEAGGEGFGVAPLARLLVSQDVLMLAAVAGSLGLTRKEIRRRNEFTFGPIKEVAMLFLGIFSTMVPALQYLGANADRLPLRTPGQYYFSTGVLSAVLDNAPTYLTFLELRLATMNDEHGAEIQQAEAELRRMADAGAAEPGADLPEGGARAAVEAVARGRGPDLRGGTVTRKELEVAFLIADPELRLFLVAVSVGSVFFGACTYIGNGPNFMVKSIADSMGVRTPGFVGYVAYSALPLLVRTCVIVWLVFFAPAAG